MTDTALSPEEQLIEDIAGFTHDPLGYALYAFPWGEEGTELAHATGPRQWQADAFREIRDHLQNPEARYQPLMLARASGHGIGKSAFISMLINWGMSTCEDCKVVVTANTDNQLRTKTWPEIIKWSNPTRNTGRFRECFRKYKHRWKTAQIDSRTVEGTNKQQLQKWVDDYGEDSDFVKIRVRGIFPDASELQFIPTGLTDEAMKRVVTAAQVAHAPVIIGVDPAYSGVDDAVIYLRQGLHSKVLWTGNKTTDDLIMAKRIADFEDQYQADAVFIDFGYGTGLKSIGDGWGRTWQLVPFGGASTDPQMLNKRGEMFNSCKTWLRLGGMLDDQETADDLSAAEYKVRVDGKIVIEPKEDIKERLGRSPGKGDALLLTFAFPVSKRINIPGQQSQQGRAITDYDPYA